MRQLARAERVEEVGIEDKKRNHLSVFQGLNQRLMIGDPQVFPSEPYQRSMDSFHGDYLGTHFQSAVELPQLGNEKFLQVALQ